MPFAQRVHRTNRQGRLGKQRELKLVRKNPDCRIGSTRHSQAAHALAPQEGRKMLCLALLEEALRHKIHVIHCRRNDKDIKAALNESWRDRRGNRSLLLSLSSQTPLAS